MKYVGTWLSLLAVVPVSNCFVSPLPHIPLSRNLKSLRSNQKDNPDGPPRSSEDQFNVDELKSAWSMGKEAGNGIRKEVVRRFQDPKIDDVGLIITDALVAGIIAPGIEIFLTVGSGSPLPHWVYPSSGLITSVLVRGATLAACFVAGAFAAEVTKLDIYENLDPPAKCAQLTFCCTHVN